MIPQEFDYEHPSSVADAIAMLGKHGGEARILAGGHSLVPLMKLRLAAPDALIDIGGIASLRGITDTPDSITIGALTTHAEVAASDVVAAGNAAEAAEHAADGLDPPSDTAASGEYRAHLAKVLVRRALEAAMAR